MRARENASPAGRAAAPESQSSRDKFLQLVSFRVGGEEFGLDILRLQEIIRPQQLTRVPNSPAFMDGVINLRGKIIPVISLRKVFGFREPADNRQTRILVVEVHGSVLGFMVDSVSEVLRVSVDTVEPPPRPGKVQREYVSGVGKLDDRLLILLDMERLMNDSEQAGAKAAPVQAQHS